MNLQFFAKDTGGKKATAKSTFGGKIHKDKNGVAFDTPISLKQALEELDASGLRPGQTELHVSQLNEALDGIQNHYDPKRVYSSVYCNGAERYLFDGHHIIVEFKMLGKNTVFGMNEKSYKPPEVTGLYWTKKWYQFWRKTIKIKN